MGDTLQFETPENVEVHYVPAGVGTRFIAWLIDQLFVFLTILAVGIILAVAGISFRGAFESLDRGMEDPQSIGLVFAGLFVLILGLGSLVYFTLSELLFSGQTVGKRAMRVRVVKVDGFALDAGSILIRNLFRVIDNLPLVWIVPLMSARSQRLGDMVAGTVIISDAPPELTDTRSRLSERQAIDSEFRFDARTLERLQEQDFEAVEQLLERWDGLQQLQRLDLMEKIALPLARKMQLDPPPVESRHRFLEDLLAAEIRRQNRRLH